MGKTSGAGSATGEECPMNMCMLSQRGRWILAMAILAAGVARAQVIAPLYVYNEIPATDVVGRNLPGTCGAPLHLCSTVEIREVGTGIVPPDPVTKQSDDAANPLVEESYMGKNALGTDPGLFGEVLEERIVVGEWYFVRVFDLDRLYYADTAAFQAPEPEQSSVQSDVEVVFGGMKLVSGAEDEDTDGDGIPDELEFAVGLDPFSRDSRGDGWDDLFVLLMEGELELTDPNPIVVEFRGAGGEDPLRRGSEPYSVSWWSIPGVWYRLDHRVDLRDEAPEVWAEIWSGEATESELDVDVDDYVLPEGNEAGFFRVQALPYYVP